MGICIVRVTRDREYVQFKAEASGRINEGIKAPSVFIRGGLKDTRELDVAAKRVNREGANNGITTALSLAKSVAQ